jgi:hypothetical protein
VTITENGRRPKISKLDAAVTQLANDAARGDKKAIQFIFALLPALATCRHDQQSVVDLAIVARELVQQSNRRQFLRLSRSCTLSQAF